MSYDPKLLRCPPNSNLLTVLKKWRTGRQPPSWLFDVCAVEPTYQANEERWRREEEERIESFQLMFSFFTKGRRIPALGTGKKEELVEIPTAEQLLPLIKEVADSAALDPILRLESTFQAYMELQAELRRSPDKTRVSQRDEIMKSLLEAKAIDNSRQLPIAEMASYCADRIAIWEACGEGVEEAVSGEQAVAEYEAFVEGRKEGKRVVDEAVLESRVALAAVLEGLTAHLRSEEKEAPRKEEFVGAAAKFDEALAARKVWEEDQVAPALERCWRSEIARWKEFRRKIQRAAQLGEKLVEWKFRAQACTEQPRFSPEEYQESVDQKDEAKHELAVLQSKLRFALSKGRPTAEIEINIAILHGTLREIDKSLKEQRSRLSMFDIYPEDRLHISALAKTSSKSLTEFNQLEEISSGDRHVVFKAEYDDKPCILKRFQLGSATQQKAFMSESEILRRLTHPNIVRIDDSFLEDDYGYLQMPVYQPLSSAKSFVVRSVLLDVLLGLEYCHANGVIHCDVKIDNILLDSTGRACLADFDISRDAQSRMTTANLGGTLGYVAPEVVAGGGHSAASDMFSFGLLALDLACPKEQSHPGARPKPVIPVGVEATLKDLLVGLFKESPANRPTATQCRSHRYFTSPPAPLRCPVCFQFEEGVKCARGHFICNDCLGGYVGEFVKKDISQKRKVGGVLRCSAPGCMEPYGEAELAVRISTEQMKEYQQVRLDLHEEKLATEFQKVLEAKEKEWVAQSTTAQIERHIHYINEWILTLRCPSPGCHLAFVDFNGCGALICAQCDCHFCCWCLADCGADAHQHVVFCGENPNPGDVFTSEAAFANGQKDRKRKMVAAYLAKLGPELRIGVEKVINPQLS